MDGLLDDQSRTGTHVEELGGIRKHCLARLGGERRVHCRLVVEGKPENAVVVDLRRVGRHRGTVASEARQVGGEIGVFPLPALGELVMVVPVSSNEQLNQRYHASGGPGQGDFVPSVGDRSMDPPEPSGACWPPNDRAGCPGTIMSVAPRSAL